MAKNKIERIDQEIAKTREKIAEQQEKLKALEAQKTEAENLEIVQMVRALRMTPAQLSAMGGEPGDRPDGARPAHDPGPAVRHAVRRHGARPGSRSRRSRTGGNDP